MQCSDWPGLDHADTTVGRSNNPINIKYNEFLPEKMLCKERKKQYVLNEREENVLEIRSNKLLIGYPIPPHTF